MIFFSQANWKRPAGDKSRTSFIWKGPWKKEKKATYGALNFCAQLSMKKMIQLYSCVRSIYIYKLFNLQSFTLIAVERERDKCCWSFSELLCRGCMFWWITWCQVKLRWGGCLQKNRHSAEMCWERMSVWSMNLVPRWNWLETSRNSQRAWCFQGASEVFPRCFQAFCLPTWLNGESKHSTRAMEHLSHECVMSHFESVRFIVCSYICAKRLWYPSKVKKRLHDFIHTQPANRTISCEFSPVQHGLLVPAMGWRSGSFP